MHTPSAVVQRMRQEDGLRRVRDQQALKGEEDMYIPPVSLDPPSAFSEFIYYSYICVYVRVCMCMCMFVHVYVYMCMYIC